MLTIKQIMLPWCLISVVLTMLCCVKGHKFHYHDDFNEFDEYEIRKSHFDNGVQHHHTKLRHLNALNHHKRLKRKYHTDQEQQELLHWPVKKEAVMEGHVILGGLMMVHEREDNMTCGPIMPQGGIQALEAMMYTLDRINEQKLLPDITIGAHILDDCDKDTYGLEMAVDFIKGKF